MIITCFDITVLSSLPSFSSSPSPSWKFTLAKSQTNAVSVTTDYASVRADTLRAHLRTHNREKPKKCNTCSFVCFDPNTLRSFIRKSTSITTLYLPSPPSISLSSWSSSSVLSSSAPPSSWSLTSKTHLLQLCPQKASRLLKCIFHNCLQLL